MVVVFRAVLRWALWCAEVDEEVVWAARVDAGQAPVPIKRTKAAAAHTKARPKEGNIAAGLRISLLLLYIDSRSMRSAVKNNEKAEDHRCNCRWLLDAHARDSAHNYDHLPCTITCFYARCALQYSQSKLVMTSEPLEAIA